jgi:hypothetical protein
MNRRYLLLGAVGTACVAAALLRGRVTQDPRYHRFADQRAVAGVPRFFDVASNIPFLIVGIAGLLALRKHPAGAAYRTFFIAAILIALGSARYHLRPDNSSLVFDRAPMTLAFMALVAIVTGEHIDAQLGRRALPALLIAGIASVIYWHMTDDLRPYILVQYVPMALVPLTMLLFPSRFSTAKYVWATFGLYAAAKGFELCDERIFDASGVVSGHTLKHITGAAAMSMLVLAVRGRK